MADFRKQKQYLKRKKSIQAFKICCCRDELGQRTNWGNLNPQTVSSNFCSLSFVINSTFLFF